MSQENVEIVRALQPGPGVDLAAATKGGTAFGDIQSAPVLDDFESVFIAPESAAARIGPYRGVDGLIAAWQDWLEPWERYEFEAQEFIDAGDRVVVFAHVKGRTWRDGVEMEHEPAAVYTLSRGLVSHIAFYLDRQEALEAVGLME